MASVPIVVPSEGLHGLVITTGPGASVTGTVVAASGMVPPASGLQVVARAARGGIGVRGAQSAVGRDSAFELTGLAGAYRLDVERMPQGWTLAAILVGGVDVTDNPMDFCGSERVSGVRVILTDRVTELRSR